MDLLQQFTSNVNFTVLILVILGGLFAKKYLTKWKLDNAWKTLIVGTVFVVVYIIVQAIGGSFHKSDLSNYFFTYCAATSLYELFLKKFIDLIKRNTVIGNK